MTSPRHFGENNGQRQTLHNVNSRGQLAQTATISVEQRGTKSAQKMMLSPSHSKSNMKTKTHRLTGYNSFKIGSSTAIKTNPAKQGKPC